MHTLVLDIETVGEDWNSFDSITQDSLLRWITRGDRSEKERRVLKDEVKKGLGLSPFTGKIVSLCLYDLEREEGVVYYHGDDDEQLVKGEFIFRTRTEKELLEDFWEGAREYDTFVTFSGRQFDVPYILLRSAIHGIKPTRELMRSRYLNRQGGVKHIDIQDQLMFYGAFRRRPSLHLATNAFGIESSKVNGISGENIGELFHQKKFRDIAAYNTGDVIATAKLYKKWFEYLAPRDFTGEDIM